MDNFDKKTHKSYRIMHAAQTSIVSYCTTTISIAALATFSPIKAAPHVEIERERVIHPSDSPERRGFS